MQSKQSAANIAEKRQSQQRSQLRLSIAVPVLLVLFPLVYGLISLRLHDHFIRRVANPVDQDIFRELLRGQILTMLGLSVVALVTGVGLVYFEILRPIRAIQDAIGRISRGELAMLEAYQYPTAPELGELSRSFESMIGFVNNSIQERNRYMMEAIHTGILTADSAGTVIGLNETGAEILGIETSAVIGRSVRELERAAHDRHRILWEHLGICVESGNQGGPATTVLHARDPHMSLHVATSWLTDQAGRPTAVILNFRDADKIRHLHERLARTDQLAALGTFSMGLTHEIRNPLGTIKGTAQLMKMEIGAGGGKDIGHYADRIVHEINRLDEFVTELLDFSQRSPTPPRPNDLNEILRAAVNQVRSRMESENPKPVEIELKLEATGKVLVEFERLVQAFGNMIRNAWEAVEPGGIITVMTSDQFDNQRGLVAARIRNAGAPIPESIRDKVFDPFFTTKERGSGLGLAIAYQIVTQQPGSLELEEGSEGTTFVARFPASGTGAGAKTDESVVGRRV